MKQRADLTFKHNRGLGRHGWLRLTPAYSVKLVGDILRELDGKQVVIEPFSGTGTTAVVSAEQGSACDAFDINPFLIWLGEAKARNYSANERAQLMSVARQLVKAVPRQHREEHWLPPISAIERWWSLGHLRTLSAIYAGIGKLTAGPVADLLKIAFSRIVIDWSNAAFNHQSISFKEPTHHALSFDDEPAILQDFVAWTESNRGGC